MTKRRSNGEGAIYQTKDGRWRAAVDLGWKDGKRDESFTVVTHMVVLAPREPCAGGKRASRSSR